MSIGVRDRKLLWGRARNECAFPACAQELIPDLADADAAVGDVASPVVLGEEAHIRSEKTDGPRHDANYASELIDTYDNLILLCGTHHTLVDKDGGRGFSVKDLAKMKQRHERAAARDERLERVYRAYLTDRYDEDDKVLFEAVDLSGPTVESMFVDVPIAAPAGSVAGVFVQSVQAADPGDVESRDETGELEIAGAAQVFLHPGWKGNALIQGGPGQGKSTLLQYVCQFHRSRQLDGKDTRYTGTEQGLRTVTSVARIPIRIDLRHYAAWMKRRSKGKAHVGKGQRNLEVYLTEHVADHAGMPFAPEDLVTMMVTKSVLIALDGLDEVASIDDRNQVSSAIVAASRRLHANAADLVILVATRPGATDSALWSDTTFPILTLRPLSIGLKVQYLNQWCVQAKVTETRTGELRAKLLANQDVAHIRELGSNPMQLAILLHLLYRRGLLPQQRTELYQEYVKTFLDREEQDKEPLVHSHRRVIIQIHAYLAWHLQSQAELGSNAAGYISRADLKQLLHKHLADSKTGLELADSLFTAMTSRVLCLVERRPGNFEFEVQSLREYFAALHIFEESPAKGARNSRDDCLNALLDRPYWSNVMRFFVGMLSKGEIKSLIDNLQSRRTNKDSRLDPYFRWVAALLLDDRVYENQTDTQLARAVDFVLEGPGVVFGEDGLLDAAGTPLHLAEEAGAAQAADHARARLQVETDPELRRLLAACLIRHGDPVATREWSWSITPPVPDRDWLETVADLRFLGALGEGQLERVVQVAGDLSTDIDSLGLTWLLARGEYDGAEERLISLCAHEVADGAGNLVDVRRIRNFQRTPLSALVAAGNLHGLRDRRQTPTTAGPTGSFDKRRRIRNNRSGTDLLNRADAFAARLRATGQNWGDPAAWTQLVNDSLQLWGDCWLTRQIIALVPPDLDLSLGAAPVASTGAAWREHAAWIQAARANAGNINWWRGHRPDSHDELGQRYWAFGLLAIARTKVVQDLFSDLGEVIDELPTRHYRALRSALHAYKDRGYGRTLNLREALRLRQIRPSPRTASLLTHCCVADGLPYLDKAVVAGISPLLREADPEDWVLGRHLRHADAKLSLEDLRGTRHAFTSGGLAEVGGMPSLTQSQAQSVLDQPHDWPAEVVRAAARKISQKRAGSRPGLAAIAAQDDWFQE